MGQTLSQSKSAILNIMVGVKAAPGGPVRVHTEPAVEDHHLDLPHFDCRISDDFKELADCQLVCDSQKIKCHSQVSQEPRRGPSM